MKSFRYRDLHRTYFCTGARNHDLLKTIADPRFELDERIASFKALGATKATLRPAGICTTSGTAVAECIPAMLEALYSRLPLVLITGDRPKKQHGTGAPQTLDHESLTRSCRGSYFEIDLQELETFEVEDPEFPLHINVIVDDTSPHQGSVKRSEDFSQWAEFMGPVKRPLFLISHEEESLRPFAEKLRSLGIPFYAETLSGAHDLSVIRSEVELLEHFREGAFDAVIRIGHTPLSKLWRLLETKFLPVASFDSRSLSALSYGTVYPFSASSLLETPEFWAPLRSLEAWSLPPSRKNADFLVGLCEKFPESEISLLKKIQDALPQNALVYLGNSLVIRNFELVQTKAFRVFGNRGVNGIDGQLSSAIGLAEEMTEIVYCILGDLTLRYDLTALMGLPKNLKVIVINNRGGRIFESLNLDPRIVLSHEENFEAIARAFRIRYGSTSEDIPGAQLIEIFTDLSQSQALMKELRS